MWVLSYSWFPSDDFLSKATKADGFNRCLWDILASPSTGLLSSNNIKINITLTVFWWCWCWHEEFEITPIIYCLTCRSCFCTVSHMRYFSCERFLMSNVWIFTRIVKFLISSIYMHLFQKKTKVHHEWARYRRGQLHRLRLKTSPKERCYTRQ